MIGIVLLVVVTCFPYTVLSQLISYDVHVNNSLVAENCNDALNVKDILMGLLHPGGILILTDCNMMESFSKDITLFSYISFAIVHPLMANAIRPNIFGESKPFILVNLYKRNVNNVTNTIYRAFQHSSRRAKIWQPTIVIIWQEEIIRPATEINLIGETFEGTSVYFDCNIFIIFVNNELVPIKMSVWEIYNIRSRKMISVVGSKILEDSACSNGSYYYCNINDPRVEVISLHSYVKRRRNFQLEKFIATVKYDPHYRDWAGLTQHENGTFTLKSGYSAVLYWDLQTLTLLNFSEIITIGDTPMVYPNGSLGGTTVRQLTTGEADVTLNQISLSSQRAKALTFLQPTYYSLVYVFFKQPTRNSVRDVVTSAFERELWISLMGMWAFLAISVQVRRILLANNIPSPFPWWHFTFSPDYRFAKESVLWSVATICQKSWYLNPSSTSLRMKFVIGSIVSVILYTAYSASIVSSLAVNKIPVKGFADLISFNFIFTVHESSEPYQTMLKGMITTYDLRQDVATSSTNTEISHLFKSSAIGSQLQTSKKAFLSSADMFYKTAETLNYSDIFICDHVSSVAAGPIPFKSGMLVTKGSEYKEILNHMIIYMRGRGMISRYIEKYNKKNFLHCNKNHQRAVEPAVLGDVFTIVIVLLLGVLLAFCLFTFELMYAAHCSNCRQRDRTGHGYGKVGTGYWSAQLVRKWHLVTVTVPCKATNQRNNDDFMYNTDFLAFYKKIVKAFLYVQPRLGLIDVNS